MSAKTSPARRAAFMAVVAETGNQTLACERAKVSRSWVTLHRSTDPAFRAELDAAVATARERLAGARAAGESMAPGRGWGAQGGEELVARGGNGRRTQIARARLKQWTPRVEARFLTALAGCANVKAACAHVGLSPASAYNHRHRWTAFAVAWDAALEEGYLRVEAALLARFADTGDPRDAVADAGDGEPVLPPMQVYEAMQLLRLHQHRVLGIGKAPGLRRRPRTLDEVRESIVRKVEMIRRQAGGPDGDGPDAARPAAAYPPALSRRAPD